VQRQSRINQPLKQAIYDSGLQQRFICELVSMTTWRLSRIVNGAVQARDAEKLGLARVLRKPVTDLFEAA
jgi:predicted XRE-type DNA-binding protein